MMPNSVDSIVIRPATLADIPQIRALGALSWDAAYRSFLSHEFMLFELERDYSDASLLTQMSELKHRFLLLERVCGGDQDCESPQPDSSLGPLVGFISFHFVEPSDANTLPHLFINKLYLAPSLKGQGFGSKLLASVMDEAKRLQCERIDLMVNRQNSAVQFYQKLGFRIVGECDTEVGPGFWRNDYKMSLSLV